ncbi:MAG: PaaI family thioesterase [Xanthobacteraceae bacterium]
MRPSALSVADLEGRLSAEFPGSFNRESGLAILEAWHGGCRVRLGYSSNTLRPGGTISGVTMMMLADLTMYVAVLASIGWKPLAVTTSLNINFLRKAPPAALIAQCRLIKLGRRLAVGDVSIQSEEGEDLVAHATSTYSIPPQ